MRLLADRLTIERGGRRLVADLSFAVAGGCALVLTGPNGAGKSTLLRVVAGLLRATGGRIDWQQDGAVERPVAEDLHYVGHADALKTALTVRENLRFWRAMLAGRMGTGPADAPARLGLGRVLDLPVRDLSAGQRRRVALARLLVAPRPLWLLDEPTSSLDAETRDRFAALMTEHLAGGGLIVAATHAPLGLVGASELRLGGTA